MPDTATRCQPLLALALAILISWPAAAPAGSTQADSTRAEAPSGDPCALPRVSGDEPEGIGGTGRRPGEPGPEVRATDLGRTTAVAGGGDEDDSGVGGTGIADEEPEGLGGTGVVGTITGFGSICVNGLRIRYDAATPTEVNGVAGASESLEVGQVVAVEASSTDADPRALFARRIAVRQVVRGRVDRIASDDSGQSELSVVGQRVIVDDEGLSEEVVVGAEVAVSGHRRADGRIAASRIDIIAAGEPASLIGELALAGAGDARVAGVTILLGGTLDTALAGEQVMASGIWNPAAGRLEKVGLEAAVVFPSGTRAISLGGYVSSSEDGAGLRVGPFRVDLADVDAVPRQGDYIVVRGVLTDAGRVRAARLALDVRPPRFTRPRPPRIERPVIDRPESAARGRNGRPDRPPQAERPPTVVRPPVVDRPPRPPYPQIRPKSPL